MSTVRVETDSIAEIEVPARTWPAQPPLPAGGDGPAEVVNGRSAAMASSVLQPPVEIAVDGGRRVSSHLMFQNQLGVSILQQPLEFG